MKAIARLVAPTNPLGRFGSALAVTAVLTSVQVGLVAGHTGPDLCRLAGSCSPPEHVAGGAVLQNQSAGHHHVHPAASRRPALARSNPTAATSRRLQTVAVQAPAANAQTMLFKTAKADPGFSGTPELRRAAHTSAAKAHHATRHHPRSAKSHRS